MFEGIGASIIAAVLYDASKGIYRRFNKPFSRALDDTSVYFSKERGIEFKVEQLKSILEGDIGTSEIECFKRGEDFIDRDKLALQFAIFGGLYFDDESQILPVAKEILDYFIEKFEHHLLANRETGLSTIANYIKILQQSHRAGHEQVITMLQTILVQQADMTGHIMGMEAKLEKDYSKIQDRLDYYLPKIAQSLGIPTFSEKLAMSIEETFCKDLEEIKDLIDKGQIITAREKAIEIENKLSATTLSDKEVEFLVYAYIAQTFLNTLQEQDKALPYLLKAAEVCTDEERKYRNLALAYLLKKEYALAIEAIDKALDINPNKIEAVNIKANILIADGRITEARKLYSEKILPENPKLYHTRAWVLYKAKDLSIALEDAEKAIELNPNLLEAHILIADIIITQVKQDTKNEQRIIDSHYNAYQKALKHLSVAIKHLNTEEQDKFADALAKRGFIYYRTGDFSNSKSDLEKASTIFKNNPVILKDLILACWALDEYQVALDYLRTLKSLTTDDAELCLLEAAIHMESGHPHKAIRILEEAITCQATDSVGLRFHTTLIEAYDLDFQTGKAEAMLEELERQYVFRPEVIAAKAAHMRRLGDFANIVALLESTLENTEGYLKTKLTILLADALYEKSDVQDYNRAAELYGSVASIYIIDRILERYATSLYYSRQLVRCLELCREVQEIHGFVKLFSELEAVIYYNSDNFYAASEIYKALAQKHSNNVHYLINYGYSLFRIGKVDMAFDAIRQAEKAVGDSAQDMALISTVYASVGKFNEALEFAWKAVKQESDNPDIHRHYMFLFLRTENFLSDFEKKYVKTYQDCMENFNERFPNEKDFEKLEVSTEPNQFHQEILKLLEDCSGQREYFERIYCENHLPVGFLAQSAGRSTITTWDAATALPSLNVWASSGNPKELKQEINCAEQAKVIVIDTIAILTLNALKLLRVLLDVYDEIIVCQSVLDEFQELIAIKEFSVQKGQMFVWAKDGKLYRQEIPAESVRRSIKALKKVFDFLSEEEKIKIVGKSVERLENEDTEINHKIAELLGIEATETLLESSSRALPMYAEDWWLRELGQSEFNVQGFGTRALLDVLLQRELIAEDEYHNFLIDLLCLNYHFISIHAKTLISTVKSEDFIRTKRSFVPFDSLRHKDNDEQLLINLAISFLKWLWLESISDKYKEQWTDIILNVVTANRNKHRLINQVINRKREIFSPLVSHIEKKFDFALGTWIAAQRVI